MVFDSGSFMSVNFESLRKLSLSDFFSDISSFDSGIFSLMSGLPIYF
ncbi:MAG: hypothetical protein ACD_80C00062G0001 [uncultured bacterium (gcode 4)]|uniref:Uncharacterized protein n=1 Tax=uncultured bacterium (gcode 4) TaxID=1234023 RepID=K1XJQ2_9BACT|nr:MAG: hypothetical protein ACD_80C00062G0001 [uncultured bacterium (gcode 4)]